MLLPFVTERLIIPQKYATGKRHSHKQNLHDSGRKYLYILLLLSSYAVWPPPQPLSAQKTTTNEITVDEINLVARELWCPLCSDVRLDVCELKACAQMREQIGIQLANNTSVEEIKTYFIERYGPQVMGEPPRSGFSWLAWAVPFMALATGALLLLRRAHTMFAPTQHITAYGLNLDSAYSDRELDATPVRTRVLHNRPAQEPVDERYADALDKELNAYE